MMKNLYALIFVCYASANFAFAQDHSLDSGMGNLKYIDPRIGNVGALLQPTRPTVQLPNQMIRMYPNRVDYLDDQIESFPLNVVSHRLGEVFAIRPSTDHLTLKSWEKRMTYDHDLEVNRSWYYSTYLIDEEVKVEFTPGKKTGSYRFKFPDGPKAILFENYNQGSNEFKFISDTEITGIEIYHGNIKVYMYGVFSDGAAVGTVKGNRLSEDSLASGAGSKAWIRFLKSPSGLVEFRYGISYVSAAQAKKNYDNEIKDKSFDQQVKAGEEAWSKVINQIQTEGGTDAQKRSFYTALYRCYERMVDINEDGHYYSGFDHKIHQASRPFYIDDWAWDTYLAHHPLRTILDPAKEEDMLNSYVSMYEQSGWMPTFPVLFGDHACMNGFHSSIMFLDGYRKGLKNFDINKAYQGMYKNATQATMLPWRNGVKTELDDFYYKNGYFPALHPKDKETVQTVDSFEKRQAVAVTLGASYDDWALGELGTELQKLKDGNIFSIRSKNYINLWNDKLKMFIPKDSSGNWINIDPKFDGGQGGRDYYDENNGWTYMWQVQHDIPGLTQLMGGRQAFEKRLDQLFREGLGRSKNEFWNKFPDATGLVGQFSMGNEPSFHIPYLYNMTGSPWKTQKRVRMLLDVWFKDNVFGIPGDEDGGGMSAFVVFSSMGFYPLTPGNPMYTIGSPVFSKVKVNLSNGKQFVLDAENCSVTNKYIQSATLNGQAINKPWFTHKQLMEGGNLKLVMGPLPNKIWGTE